MSKRLTSSHTMCVSVAGQQRARRFPRLDSAARGIRSIFYGEDIVVPQVAAGEPSKSMRKKVRIRARTRRYDVIQLKKLPLCNLICRSSQQQQLQSMPLLFQSKPTPVAPWQRPKRLHPISTYLPLYCSKANTYDNDHGYVLAISLRANVSSTEKKEREDICQKKRGLHSWEYSLKRVWWFDLMN